MFCLNASWVALRILLGPSCSSLGEALGLSWVPLGRSWGCLGRSWGALGPLLGHSCAFLGRAWAGLRRILVLLGASGPLWGRPGGSQEPPETLFGTILVASGDDLGTIFRGIWEQLDSYLDMLFFPPSL